MTANQTSEQRALMDVIEGWYSTTNTGSREDIESAVEAYGEARYEAGRRDALQREYDRGWLGLLPILHSGRARGIPTETKPTEER